MHRSDNVMKIHCNTGVVDITHKVKLPGYGLVWFNRYGIANILSMENTTKNSPVTYEISAGDKFTLQKGSKQLIFNRSPSRICFHYSGARDIIRVGSTKENCEVYEALPENEALPGNKDNRGENNDEYEITNEVSHTSTLTPSTQAVYGMYRLRKNQKHYYS